MTSRINELSRDIESFVSQRDWNQFHSLKNLVAGLSIEASELQEVLLWKAPDEPLSETEKQRIQEELGDVLIYALMIAKKTGVDLVECGDLKLKKNEQKYPVEKARGLAKKYNEL